jgi:hypothetical protein
MPPLCEFYPGICLTTEEEARKTSVRLRETSVRVQYTYYQNTHTLQNPHTLTHTHTHTHTLFFLLWHCDPTRVMASSFLRFLDHTQRRTTVGRTHLDEWSARRRELYLTTHNTHNRQTSMPPVGFQHTISAGVRSQTYALDRAAIGTGN